MQANLCKHFNVGILKIWIICILRTVYFYSKYYFHIEYSTFRNIKPILISITIRDAFKKCAKFRGTWALLKVYEHIYLHFYTNEGSLYNSNRQYNKHCFMAWTPDQYSVIYIFSIHKSQLTWQISPYVFNYCSLTDAFEFKFRAREPILYFHWFLDCTLLFIVLKYKLRFLDQCWS